MGIGGAFSSLPYGILPPFELADRMLGSLAGLRGVLSSMLMPLPFCTEESWVSCLFISYAANDGPFLSTAVLPLIGGGLSALGSDSAAIMRC